LKTNVFAELTWYPDGDFTNLVQALCETTETEPSTMWREFGQETFEYFADIFGDYMNPDGTLGDLITTVNRIHQHIKNDGLGTPPRMEFRRASPDNFEIRCASNRKMDDFFLGMLEGAVKHYGAEVNILGKKERGKLTVTINVKEPEAVLV
jgi:hypothetical protein